MSNQNHHMLPDSNARRTPSSPLEDVQLGLSRGKDPVSGALEISSFAKSYACVLSSGDLSDVAIWFVDMRNFRSINPQYGFARGNQVLQIVAESIAAIMSHELPVARLGGDRFVFLTSNMSLEEATKCFALLAPEVEGRIRRMGINHTVVLVAGVYYLRPQDYQSRNHQQPLEYASTAHRRAHDGSEGMVVPYTDEDLERDTRRLIIEQSFDEALADGQIQVWYQPQIDYIYGEVVGAEALARWNHQTLGWISPAEFVPVLESCGKVRNLHLFVWEEACRSAGRWRSMADEQPVPISVNVSRNGMFESDLMERFLELRQKYELPPESLRLEVTESAFLEEADKLYRIVERMRSQDMMVEMDDFGSGLSTLTMLKDVPVDVVKLDMGFLRSAMNEERGGVVLGSVIRMLQGLDTPIIAEGVETLEQAEMLKNMGCHLMQGFQFSRPMPLSDFEGYLASNRAVEVAERRERKNSHVEELMSVDASSSYLFNHAIGGTVFFYAGDGVTESILVNDKFYEECGLERAVFGDRKINPIDEIAPASQASMWRATAEARQYGSALCRAQVRISGRWIQCVIRYLGASSRGDVFSLNIVHAETEGDRRDQVAQSMQDLAWDIDLLNEIVPNGFVKCDVSDSLTIAYVSPSLKETSGLEASEFTRRFHNSFASCVIDRDLPKLMQAVQESRDSNKVISLDVGLHHGYGSAVIEAHLMGRVRVEKDLNTGEETPWLYLLLMLMGEPVESRGRHRTVQFDYYVDDDRLVIRSTQADRSTKETVLPNLLAQLDSPDAWTDRIAPDSAAKLLAMARDLSHHPTSGFCDIKSALRGGSELRWYHINYMCEADEEGNTIEIHGDAQDANDHMGSTRWWRKQAECDSLTGLLNRSAVEQRVNLAMRTQGSGMLIMLDLDGFKQVNDDLGHLTGDALLRDVANVLVAQFRDGDVVGRYGGDEFVAFMSIANGDLYSIAKRRAERIIENVLSVSVQGDLQVGCSVGVAISNNRDHTFYDLLEVADDAMYQSKMSGKGTYTIVNMEN